MILRSTSTCKCKDVPFIRCEILLESLINAGVSGLYLVRISGLWDSSLLSHNHYTSLRTAARHCYRHLHKASTVKFSYSHSPDKIRTSSDKHIHKKKEKESTLVLCRCHFNQGTVLQTAETVTTEM